jgi:hypothetical protein
MLARKRTSAALAASLSLGWNPSKTLRSGLERLARVEVVVVLALPEEGLAPGHVLDVVRDRAARAQDPPGVLVEVVADRPDDATSSKNDAPSAKWVAAPPSIRSRTPAGVLTASKAIDPTTVTLMGAWKVLSIRVRAMRAIQQEEFGGPEVLQLVDVPRPEPQDGEVLVRVTRAGLNFADTHQRTNSYLAKATLPLIPAPRSPACARTRASAWSPCAAPAGTPSTRRRRSR